MFSFLLSLIFAQFVHSNNLPVAKIKTKTLAVHQFSLEDRYRNSYVNDVFKDNILLTINYATDSKIVPSQIDWSKVDTKFSKRLTLEPGQIFAFHDDVLPKFIGKVNKTSNAHFDSQEGFKSDGYLVGDGVCHLASILYWVAKDAGLEALAPTRHDFAVIPDVPRQFGVAIYDNNLNKSLTNELQNLYIKNNKNKTVTFVFSYNGKTLNVKAEEKI